MFRSIKIIDVWLCHNELLIKFDQVDSDFIDEFVK